MTYETDKWKFVKARDFVHPSTPRTVRVIVIHDMEAVEGPQTAENVAKYFQHPDTPSSAHICVDNNSIVQCVYDEDIAYAAPGANNDGIQIELAGYGKQTTDEWMDEYSVAMLGLAADAAAQYCLKFQIPPVHLTDNDLANGKKGIVGHVQVSDVYRKSTHTDPGLGFPWNYFIALVGLAYAKRRAGMTG